jgi:hypothetical protein
MATWFLNDPVAVYKKFNETKEGIKQRIVLKEP